MCSIKRGEGHWGRQQVVTRASRLTIMPKDDWDGGLLGAPRVPRRYG
jgi:hypothetical protein